MILQVSAMTAPGRSSGPAGSAGYLPRSSPSSPPPSPSTAPPGRFRTVSPLRWARPRLLDPAVLVYQYQDTTPLTRVLLPARDAVLNSNDRNEVARPALVQVLACGTGS